MFAARNLRNALVVVLAAVLVAAFLFAAFASFSSAASGALQPVIAEDDDYGAADNVAMVPRLGKKFADVTGLAADDRDRVLVMSNNGVPSEDNLADLSCNTVTITRLGSRGGTDTSFGDHGVFAFPKTAKSVCAGTIALDSHDRIVGTVRLVYKGSRRVRVIFRLTPDGRFDKRFGENGIVRVGSGNWGSPLGYGSNFALEILSHDTIQTVTYKPMKDAGNIYPQASYGVIQRFKSNGSRDRKFGRGGSATFNGFGDADFEVDQRGRTYAIGMKRVNSTSTSYAQIARLTNRGKIDRTYGDDGTVTLGHMAFGKTFQFEDYNTLPDGTTFFEFLQESADPDRADARSGAIDATGHPIGTIRTDLSPLAGFNFSFGKHRIAVIKSAKLPSDKGDNWSGIGFAIGDDAYDTAIESTPVEDQFGGYFSFATVSDSRHDAWMAVIIDAGENGDGAYYGQIGVRHYELDW